MDVAALPCSISAFIQAAQIACKKALTNHYFTGYNWNRIKRNQSFTDGSKIIRLICNSAITVFEANQRILLMSEFTTDWMAYYITL